MKSSAFWALFLTVCVCLPSNGFSAPSYPSSEKSKSEISKTIFDKDDEDKVEAVADSLEYSKNNKKIIAKGNVVVRYHDEHLTSDYAEVDSESKTVFAKGHVIIFHKDNPIGQGDEVEYNFESRYGSFPDGKGFTAPWFIHGDQAEQLKPGVRKIQNGSATTCNLEHPHYEVRGKSIKIIDNDKMIVKSAFIYVLNVPVFWLPYLIVPLQPDVNLPFAVSVGYNSQLGYFIETTKGFSVTKEIQGKAHLDYRTRRGVGGGIDLNYDYGQYAKGFVKGYVTQDKKAPRTSGDDSGFNNTENRTRGRLTWLHRTDVDPNTNIILRYNRLEDEYFLQEFFRHESQAEVEPQSFVTATKNTEKWGSLVHVERQMNRFERLVERQPHLQLDWRDQPLLGSKFFYQNQISYDNLNKVHGRQRPDDENVNRGDQFNELSRPFVWRKVKFSPFVNMRETFYTRDHEGDTQSLRANFGAGIDVRTHFYKTHNVTFDKMGMEINNIRHVIEPVAQYRTDKPTMNPGNLDNFDSIDRIDDADQVTLGVENRFQTKRVVAGKMRRVDILSLNSYVNYQRLQDSGGFGSGLTNLYEGRTDSNLLSRDLLFNQEVVFRPYEWLQYQVRMDASMRKTSLRSFNQDIVLKFRRLKFVFGQRYIDDIGDINGGNQFAFETNFTINPLWTIGGYIRWDAQQKGRNEYQIMFTRDLHDFILDFGYNVKNSSISSNNKEIFFDFRMKAFPQLPLRSGSHSNFSAPQMSPTVDGASGGTATPHNYYENV